MLRRFLIVLALLYPVAAHAGLPCGAYPNTLTNGTLADANQVMANFNTILNCVNGLAPLGTPVVGSESNAKANLATAGTTVTVSADSVTVGTALNGTSYTLTNYSQSINTATTGAGGMDIGTTPTSSYVAIYAIYNPTAPAISILGTSCASSCPTVYAGANMPAGYTASALLGVWPTNATPALVAGYVRGKEFQYQSPPRPLNASVTNQASLTALSLTTAIPPNAVSVNGWGQITTTGSFGGNAVSIYIGSDSTGTVLQFLGGSAPAAVALGVNGAFSNLLIATPQTMFYLTGGVGANSAATIGIASYIWP